MGRCSRGSETFFRARIRGESRVQTTMFPVMLDELSPEDYICQVIEVLV